MRSIIHYTKGKELQRSLQELDAHLLQNTEISDDSKTILVSKLMEEMNNPDTCTPGFHNRVKQLLLMRTGVAQRFTYLLIQIRQDIVEQVAFEKLLHTPKDNQVHAHNDFYTVASKKYDVPVINLNNSYRGARSCRQSTSLMHQDQARC